MNRMSDRKGLIAHWPFAGDCNDHSGNGYVVECRGVEPDASGPHERPGTAARFNGKDALIKVSDHPALRLGKGDFAVTAWIHTDAAVDVVGDILCKFDPDTRKGLTLSAVTNSGVTSAAQSNYRNLHFGIDNARLDPEWSDCGRPGNAVKIGALTVFDGKLYAGTFEIGANEKGHVWEYGGNQQWTDCDSPADSNTVSALTEFEGALYCGTGRYKPQGSALGETLNQTPGGKVYRYDGGGKWICCGHPGAEDAVPEDAPDMELYHTGKADDAIGLTVFNKELYVISNHRTGVFKYEGGEKWRHIGPNHRLLTLTVFNGKIHALVNGGPVLCYEGGSTWTRCGCPEGSTQTYSAVIHEGNLYVGTWPQGEIHRYLGGERWECVGSLGYEREVMGMSLYNGKVYAGSLPMANVWRMDGRKFTFVGNLDNTQVILRRVWSMAVYNGRLFAGTLPSGHVRSIEAGKMATLDRSLPSGWRHVAAVRKGGKLMLYLDGQVEAVSAGFNPNDYDISNDRPLTIGFGMHDYFNGRMSDLRIYNRALSEKEIAALAGK